MSGEKLEGVLYKQGEAVIGRLGKGFQKRWFSQRGNNLFYFKSKNDTQEQGYINLAEAILAQETQNKDRPQFQINTARRIWIMQAESEETKRYWINGINNYVQSLRDSNVRVGQRSSVRLETLENRLRDLECQERILQRALSIAAGRLSVSTDSLIVEAEREIESGSSDWPKSTVPEAEPTAMKTTDDKFATMSAATLSVMKSLPIDSRTMSAKMASDEVKFDDDESAPDQPKPQAPAQQKPAEEQPTDQVGAAVEQPVDEEEGGVVSKLKEPMKRFKVRVLFDYTAQQDYEISVKADEVITVLSKHGNGWWLGSSTEGKQGYFPGSYVEPIDS